MSTPALTLRRWPALLAAASLLLIALLGAAPAWAHAQLIGTDPPPGSVLPEAPEQVTLTFSEPVLLTSRRITTYDAEGGTVDSSATSSDGEVTVRSKDELGRGTFTVAWFVVSSDGHPISGSLTFSVGERSAKVLPPPPTTESSGAVTATQAVAAWATYVGLLVSAGLVAFVLLVLPRRYAGRLLLARLRRLLRLAVALAVAGSVVSVAAAGLYAQGLELDAVLTSFDASLVSKELLSAALLAIPLAVVGVLFGAESPGPVRSALLTCASLAVCSPALVGHTRSYGPGPLVLGADVAHLAAGAVWLGGLVGLALTLRSGTPASSSRRDAVVLARFSALAGLLLLVVVVAGALLGWRILGSWSALLETTYGNLLLVKVGVALTVVAVAAHNRFRLLPRVRAADPGEVRAAVLVRRTVLAEALLLVALLGVTGVLVGRAPTESAEAGSPELVSRTWSWGASRSSVLLPPPAPRAATRWCSRPPTSSAPTWSCARRSSTWARCRCARPAAGRWEALVLLPRGGAWELQVGLRVSEFDNPVTTLELELPEGPGLFLTTSASTSSTLAVVADRSARLATTRSTRRSVPTSGRYVAPATPSSATGSGTTATPGPPPRRSPASRSRHLVPHARLEPRLAAQLLTTRCMTERPWPACTMSSSSRRSATRSRARPGQPVPLGQRATISARCAVVVTSRRGLVHRRPEQREVEQPVPEPGHLVRHQHLAAEGEVDAGQLGPQRPGQRRQQAVGRRADAPEHHPAAAPAATALASLPGGVDLARISRARSR